MKMETCKQIRDVERWFDGDSAAAHVKTHVAECAECADHLAFLQSTRDAIEKAGPAPEISDAQFPAFMAGITEAVHRPRHSRMGLWAMASVGAAALIVAISTISIMSPSKDPALATIVEDYSTDIDGATVDTFISDETLTVWVNEADGDML